VDAARKIPEFLDRHADCELIGTAFAGVWTDIVRRAEMRTKHASARQQQRGIPSGVVDLILEYGQRAYNHTGCIIRYLDKRARKSIERDKGTAFIKQFAKALDVYVVESANDGCVVTCGHRYEKIRRA
jgi:hypothetical protein